MNSKIEDFFLNAKRWKREMSELRRIVSSCLLNEELKWGVPCYTIPQGNVLIIHGFKEYCALNFFKGALLNDTEKILIQQTENSQAARQLRFTNVKEILDQEATIKAYIFEAIEVEKAGLKIDFKKVNEYNIPEELIEKWNELPDLKTAFESLTPGRQKAYLLHFSDSKQPKTRLARIEKNIPRILKGKGLNDCVCGLSKRMPNCDGSHKYIS